LKDPDAVDLNELVKKSLSAMAIEQLLDLVAQHSWWVPREVYEKVPIVYPKTRRGRSKEHRGQVVDGVRLWNNEPAIMAFWTACGKNPNQMKNYYISHIYEDSVKDPLHFTNLANLTAFPKCLQSLSEWEPVNRVLKYHSFRTYQYSGPNGHGLPELEYYPHHWNHQIDLSSERINEVVAKLARQRNNRPQYASERNNRTPSSNVSDTWKDVRAGSIPPVDLPVTTKGTPTESYTKGISCPKLGLTHRYVLTPKGTYYKCPVCKSVKSIRPKS